MKRGLCFLLCVFAISCADEVHVLSSQEDLAEKPVISNKGPFSETEKKSRRRRRRHGRAFPEDRMALTGKVDFTALSPPPSERHKAPDPPRAEGLLSPAAPLQLMRPPAADPPLMPLLRISPRTAPSSFSAVAPSPQTFADFEKKQEVRMPGPRPARFVPDNKPFPPMDTPRRVPLKAPEPVFIPRPLDMMFVWDTSRSMLQNLILFKEKFAGFLEYFSGYDWKWMLTNSNHGGNVIFLYNINALKGRAMKLERSGKILDIQHLSPDMAYHRQIFLDSISLHRHGEYKVKKRNHEGVIEESLRPCQLPPHCEGDQEQPLKALKSALTQNPDFFRPEADLAVVIAGNSKESANRPDLATQAEEVIEQFRKTQGPHKRFEVYALIIPENDQDCLQQNRGQQFFFPEGDFSTNIARLSEKTGGKIFSLCAPDYRALAESIAHSFSRPGTAP